MIKPIDMGVIHNLKSHYKSLLNKRIVQALQYMDESKKEVDATKTFTMQDRMTFNMQDRE